MADNHPNGALCSDGTLGYDGRTFDRWQSDGIAAEERLKGGSRDFVRTLH
jgi:hypothetical protein